MYPNTATMTPNGGNMARGEMRVTSLSTVTKLVAGQNTEKKH